MRAVALAAIFLRLSSQLGCLHTDTGFLAGAKSAPQVSITPRWPNAATFM